MSDEALEKVSAPPELPMWLRATPEDIEGFDFEALLSDSAATKSRLFDPFHVAMKDAEARQDGRSTRVFCMLAAVTDMFFRPRDTHEPYGPMTGQPFGHLRRLPGAC